MTTETTSSRRPLVARLADRLPGFGGYRDRERRRDADRLLREHVAVELTAARDAVRAEAARRTDAGDLGALRGLDRLERSLDRLAQTVRFAEHGATGLFAENIVRAERLDAIYRHDLAVADDVADLRRSIDAGFDAAEIESRIAALDSRWSARRALLDGASVPGGSREEI
ncbi:MAG: hypothetical protein AAGN46_05885 [Acidobacteriota bacterium]